MLLKLFTDDHVFVNLNATTIEFRNILLFFKIPSLKIPSDDFTYIPMYINIWIIPCHFFLDCTYFLRTKHVHLLKSLNFCEAKTKLYFTHYSSVAIILFKRVYVGLHFLPILLENLFFVFLSFLCFFASKL